MCALQKHVSPQWWHHIHRVKDVHWCFFEEKAAEGLWKGSRQSCDTPSIPLPITQLSHCLWHTNSVWQCSSSSRQHFSSAALRSQMWRIIELQVIERKSFLTAFGFSWQKKPSDFCLSSLSFQWKNITFPPYPPFSVLPIKHHSSSAGVGSLHRRLIFLVMLAYSGALSFKSLGDTFLNN